MADILNAIIPVFLIIGAGFFAERIKLASASLSAAINAYAIYLALPALLIHILATAAPDNVLQWRLWLGALLVHLIVYAACYGTDLLVFRRGGMPAAVSALAGSGSMGAFVGIPIIMNLLPGNQEALVAAGIVAIIPSLFLAVGQIQLEMLQAPGGPQPNPGIIFLKSVFLNPLIIGVLIGLAICLTGLGLWQPLEHALALMGNTSAPCALMALGLSMNQQLKIAARAKNKVKYQTFIVISKLIVLPLAAWGVLSALGVGGAALLVSVVVLGTGVGIGPYVMAELYKTIPDQCALAVVLTNLLSLFTVASFAYVLIKILHVI